MYLDFVFVFVLLLSCAMGFKRGFGAMVISFSAFLLSVVITAALYGNMCDYLANTKYGKHFQSTVSQQISQKIDKSTDNEIKNFRLPLIFQNGESKDDSNSLSDAAAKQTVKILTSVIILIITYILSRLIIAIFKALVRTAVSLPVVHLTDSLLGLVFGVLTGIIWCAVIYFAASYLTLVPDFSIIGEQYNSSVIANLISDFII